MNDANPGYGYGYGYGSRQPRRGGIGVPYGPLGVAALTGCIGALVGLIVPMHLIETASWQLYLDQFVAAARPPLGSTARLATIVASAALLGGLGWLVAKLLRVRTDNGVVDRLIARVRGIDGADEADAPTLRAADRHPDAPARRPFSAARDIPVSPPEVADDAPMWVDRDWSDAGAETDELLLDTNFNADVAEAAPAIIAEPAAAVEAAAMADAVPMADAVDMPVKAFSAEAGELAVKTAVETAAIIPQTAPVGGTATTSEAAQVDAAAMAQVLAAPAALRAPAPAPLRAPAPLSAPAPLPAPGSLPAPEPLDLSVARLDELIARLEAGLTRRTTVVTRADVTGTDATRADVTGTGTDRRAVVGDARLANRMPDGALDDAGPSLARGTGVGALDDPAFPQDPALAAALATLRRMNGNPH